MSLILSVISRAAPLYEEISIGVPDRAAFAVNKFTSTPVTNKGRLVFGKHLKLILTFFVKNSSGRSV